jgi:hypothetical protein
MIGYFYWGFLGDAKFNKAGEPVSTPDGNAFYSWSIIKAAQDHGQDVLILCDKDYVGYNKLGDNLFASFAKDARLNAWKKCSYIRDHKDGWINDIENTIKNLDYAIVEWRWNIPGRNDLETKKNHPEIYQPDQELMADVINMCNKHNVPVIIFDLDYKITEEHIKQYNIKYIIELGNKWTNSSLVKAAQIQIPFDFTYIDEFPIRNTGYTSDVIYIGNRYERDWCIDKYLPEGTVVHGNWLEPGHGDPENEWPHLKFRKRLTANEIQKPYNEAVATVLLAKKEYCEMGFMTARIQEAVFYGTVPFFIEEYGKDVINTYAGKYANFLTVVDKSDLNNKIIILKQNPELRKDIIEYMRKHLRFMDSKFFINDIEEIIKK